MKALEGDVGLSLFRRINNSLYPTEAARVLMRGADPLLMAEFFARRWVAAPVKTKLKLLSVDIGLSFTIGGVTKGAPRGVWEKGGGRPPAFFVSLGGGAKKISHLRGAGGDLEG